MDQKDKKEDSSPSKDASFKWDLLGTSKRKQKKEKKLLRIDERNISMSEESRHT